ncbi:hypothetical protein BDA99DRAFT_431767 [Phascolomyces articulosus]|uniref:6-methylsalicylate decarboxylase n=1 Tax=Phascolomyces articulosus TaxID=60185 RepID=A0AAD5PI26_9FUNG|nr:hypothetical protein BDA99DRAFT_431767 [Phascolomyces articulosus]
MHTSSLLLPFTLLFILCFVKPSIAWIDTHIHVVTKSYSDAIDAAGGDPSGYAVPSWSVDSCLEFMNVIGDQRAVLSVTAPGPSISGNGTEGRKLARTVNDEVGDIVTENSDSLSFFASTPDWTDVQGTLDELDYIFATQKKAVGVVVMSVYSGHLLGDSMFKPIWEKLNDYKAIVFIHPTWYEISPMNVAGHLSQPIIDYPYGTTRTAADLLLTGRFNDCPDVDIILSHAGGVLPYLATRLAGPLLANPFEYDGRNTTFANFELNLNRFYMDVALSTSSPQLEALIAFGATDRLLFGTDFPYASDQSIQLSSKLLKTFIRTNPKGKLVNEAKLTKNAVGLFKKHGINIHNPKV